MFAESVGYFRFALLFPCFSQDILALFTLAIGCFICAYLLGKSLDDLEISSSGNAKQCKSITMLANAGGHIQGEQNIDNPLSPVEGL